jgi:hypothetical protein
MHQYFRKLPSIVDVSTYLYILTIHCDYKTLL